MDYLRALVILGFVGFNGISFAGYAQLNPPTGWSGGGTGTGGQFTGSAANASQYLGNTVRTNAALNVGGRSVVVPASLRFAANAPRIAAGLLFANPALRTGLAIASWIGVTSFIWDEMNKRWVKPSDDAVASDGYRYRISGNPQVAYGYVEEEYAGSQEAACVGFMPKILSFYGGDLTFSGWSGASCNFYYKPSKSAWTYRIDKVPGSCPLGWYVTPAGCTQTPQMQPVTEQEFGDGILNPDNQPGWPNVPADWPMPEFVPSELPFPLPIELPRINPSPAPDYNPRPFFVPQGDPIPNPNYDPNANPSPENQPYIRPGINVRPANTPDSPWNVDLQPVNRPSENAQPNPNPDFGGNPNTGDSSRPPEEVGLCDMYPDIVACQKTGELDSVPVSSSTVPLAINRDEGYGPANGSCPAPREFSIMGKTMAFRWDLFCDFANGVRPVIVGMAYLAAVLAFLGLSRKGS